MKFLNYIFEKYPFFYILLKYNQHKPLYTQPSLFLFFALIVFIFINAEVNEFVYIQAIWMFSEMFLYIILMVIFISINNNLIDIKNSGFLSQSLYSNQKLNEVLTGLFLGLSFNIIIIYIFFLFLNIFSLWFLTYDLYHVLLVFSSKIFSFILVVSLSILISNYLKIGLIISIVFFLIFSKLMVGEMGLVGVLFGTKISLSLLIQPQIIASEIDSSGFIYNAIIFKNDFSSYIILTIFLLLQAIFTYLFFYLVKKSYQYIKPQLITIKNSLILTSFLYIITFIYILIPQISSFHGVHNLNELSSSDSNGSLTIRQTFSLSKAYIYDANSNQLYGMQKIIISESNIKTLLLNNKQKEFLLTDFNENSELEDFLESLIDSELFSMYEIINITKKMISYTLIQEKSLPLLINRLKTMESSLPQLKAQIIEIEKKMEGYIYDERKVSFTFIWIYILSCIIFLNSSFQDIYQKKYKSINFEIMKHYFKFILFVTLHIFMYVTMLYTSINDLTLSKVVGIVNEYLLIIIYFPIIVFGSYFIFISNSEKYKKYLIYMHILIIISFIDDTQFSLNFISFVYIIFILYSIIFYIYHSYKYRQKMSKVS